MALSDLPPEIRPSSVGKEASADPKNLPQTRVGEELPKREPDWYCQGRLTEGRGYCGRRAGAGTDHKGYGRCSRHGGSTTLANRGAQTEAARNAVTVYGLPKKVDPHQALMEELERTSGHVSWLFLKVQEVGADDENDLVGPVGQEGPSESGGWHHAGVEPSIWLKLYQDERKHLIQTAKICIAAGIEERKVRIAESQGALLAGALQRMVERLGVADHPELAKIVREELTSLSQQQSTLELEPAA